MTVAVAILKLNKLQFCKAKAEHQETSDKQQPQRLKWQLCDNESSSEIEYIVELVYKCNKAV